MANKVIGGVEPKCAYCEHCILTENKRTALCTKRGITALDGACKKFTYDPMKRVPQRPAPLQQFSEDDFSI